LSTTYVTRLIWNSHVRGRVAPPVKAGGKESNTLFYGYPFFRRKVQTVSTRRGRPPPGSCLRLQRSPTATSQHRSRQCIVSGPRTPTAFRLPGQPDIPESVGNDPSFIQSRPKQQVRGALDGPLQASRPEVCQVFVTLPPHRWDLLSGSGTEGGAAPPTLLSKTVDAGGIRLPSPLSSYHPA